MSTIKIDKVRKCFGNVEVLKEFNQVFEDKEFVTLLGPSGCGKTTMLRMLAGFEKPTSGTITIDDKVVSSDKTFVPPEKRDIGMVFQSYAVWPHMTVFDNIAYPLKIKKVPKDFIKQKVEAIMEVVHLSQYADRIPSQLSGGQQQRVALGRALVAEPNLLLLDEPLSNLDAKLRESMRFEIKAIQKKLGITVVYVTHDQVEAMTMSDKVIVINDGVIQQVGHPMDIYRKPANQFVAAFVGKIDFIKGVSENGKITITGTDQVLDYDGELKGNVVVAVRPESIHLSRDGGKLHGVMDNKTFMGDVNDCYVRLPNGKGIRVIAPPETYDEYEIGEEIFIDFDTFHVYEDDGTDAATKIIT